MHRLFDQDNHEYKSVFFLYIKIRPCIERENDMLSSYETQFMVRLR